MDATSLGNVHLNELETKGYTVVKNVFAKSEVKEITQAYESRWLELLSLGKIKQKSNRPYESLFPRVRDYHLLNSVIRNYVLDTRITSMAEKVLGEECLIVSTSYYYKGPGMRGMPIHQDNSALGVFPGTSLSLWISLDDSYQENGGLIFAPGTHKLPLLSSKETSKDVAVAFSDHGQMVELPEGSGLEYLHAKSGDVVLFNGNMIHGSPDNVSKDAYRRALLIHSAPVGTEKLSLNFNNLLDKNGNRVRRRLNTAPKVVEGQPSIFSLMQAKYYNLTGWK